MNHVETNTTNLDQSLPMDMANAEAALDEAVFLQTDTDVGGTPITSDTGAEAEVKAPEGEGSGAGVTVH